MKQISVAELKRDTGALFRQLREGERYDVTYRGRVVALLVPATRPSDYLPKDEQEADWGVVWAEIDETATEIAKKWPARVPAVDAVLEQRRNLTPDEWVKPAED